ncbi:YceD family protein [Paenibacillus sp. sgz302251]|uniref:YceD family protein n=1 Tax=Paenibacillus sp. sgz302251 TaxID=3414493 RepID=UPI003C7C51AA
MQFHMQETMSKSLKSTINEQLDVNDLFKGRQDVYRAGSLHVTLQVTGHEGFIEVDGKLAIDLELVCSRCLGPVQDHIVIPFSEVFKRAATNVESDEYTEEEISDFVEVNADKLDLMPYVEEALQLSIPFAPLCSDDCKGLCPTCGQNLNEHKCSCQNEKIDVRFAALKDLFKE